MRAFFRDGRAMRKEEGQKDEMRAAGDTAGCPKAKETERM